MSNIRAICTDFNMGSSQQVSERVYLRRVSFADFEIFTMTDEQNNDSYYPEGKDGAIFFNTFEQLGINCGFVSNWERLGKTASCFITGSKTMMPKAIFPNANVAIKNGLEATNGDETGSSYKVEGAYEFNWKIYKYDQEDEIPVSPEDIVKYGKRITIEDGSFIGMTAVKGEESDKVENILKNQRLFLLNEPKHTDNEYSFVDGGFGGAACAFVFSFNQVNIPKTKKSELNEFSPRVRIELGSEITIAIDRSGLMVVDIDGQRQDGTLVKTKATNTPLQNGASGDNFVLFLYPVWNGIVVASGIQDSKNLVSVTNLYCVKSNNININNWTNPSITEYTQDTDSPVEILYNDEKVVTDWGNYIKIYWIGMTGNFSYTPAFFSPYGRCTVYFKDRVPVDDDPSTYKYEAFPIYSNQLVPYGGTFNIVDNEATLIEGSEDGNGFAYYKYVFEFTNEENKWTRRGAEAWGYIQKSTERTVLSIPNYNGPLALSDLPVTSDGAAPHLDEWSNYIKSISINISFDSMSGSIVLDKYAMVGQNVLPPQSVGGIQITIDGGGEILHGGNPVFSGLYMGISDSDNNSSDEWTIPLVGMEQKLEDIKLVNIPFWDGDDVYKVTDYLASYGGITISYADGGAPMTDLPRSVDFTAPAINFPTGTTVIEAVRQCAEWSNHIFMIQADGTGYMYELNDEGIAKKVYNSTIHNYETTIAESINTTPVFDNMYNNVTTVGLVVGELGSRDLLTQNQFFPRIKNTKHNLTDPNFSWLKMFVSGEDGVMTEDEIERLHKINEKKTKKYVQTGSITVPGDSRPRLLDRIKIGDRDMGYIHNISHNIDFSAKTWTTSFSVGKQ